jgi:hypothetical protein
MKSILVFSCTILVLVASVAKAEGLQIRNSGKFPIEVKLLDAKGTPVGSETIKEKGSVLIKFDSPQPCFIAIRFHLTDSERIDFVSTPIDRTLFDPAKSGGKFEVDLEAVNGWTLIDKRWKEVALGEDGHVRVKLTAVYNEESKAHRLDLPNYPLPRPIPPEPKPKPRPKAPPPDDPKE